MNTQNRLIETALIGITVATLSLTSGGNAAEAKILEGTVESQPKTQLASVNFKSLQKFKKKHYGHKSVKKVKKHKKHHGYKKSFGHKKFHLF